VKKNLFKFLIFIFSFNFLWSQEKLPLSLQGVWEAKDRFVVFYQQDEVSKPEILIVLKDFYGWYYDRACEPESLSKEFKKSINCATPPKSEQIFYDVKQSTQNPQTYLLEIEYSKSQKNYVPFCVIDENLYLQFWTKVQEETLENEELIQKTKNGFWQGNVISQGITICPQETQEKLISFYIDENNLFKINYWICDMDFDSSKASFNFQNKEYYVSKHIISANNIYTCAAGRRRFVRNMQKPVEVDLEDLLFNEDFTICVKGEPYLKRILDKSDVEYLMNLVNKENSKKRPNPPPLFPVKDLVID
jgi:hypothetical protein